MNKLEEIHAKIRRAGDQIDSLTADMDRFCTDIRQSIVREVHDEPDEQVWVFRGETPRAPIEWSLRVGEILHNLRSALDHLVSQLLLANGQKPTRQNAYPIANDESKWSRNRDRLKGVTPRIETIVERLQPYTGGINLPFDVSAFGTLHTLCNIDKHQHLHRFLVRTSGIGPIDFGENHPPLNRSSTSPPLRGSGSCGKIEKGKILLGFNNAAVELHPSFQIEVPFEDARASELPAGTVPYILHKCHAAVRGAVGLITKGTIEYGMLFRCGG